MNNSLPPLDQLIIAHKKLVYSIALSYQKPGILLDDLVQEGYIGLMEAQKHFDTTKQVQFSTYAVFWIKKYILLALQNEYKTEQNLADIQQLDNIPDQNIKAHRTQKTNKQTLTIPTTMPELEAKILHLSYEQRLPIMKIAKELGLTNERVKQIREKALRRMRCTFSTQQN